MFHRLRMMGFAVAAFGLFACNQGDKIADPSKGREGTGAARIALPPIPVGYLDSGSGGQAWFALTITGQGMDPIRQTWKLSPKGPNDIFVRNIPAGAIRLFQGELLRISSGDTAVTHEGGASAWIDRDSVAEVQLYLSKSGGGTAHVCVEVEGWPSGPDCIKPPEPVVPAFGGCWNITVYAVASPPELHQLVQGRVTFTQTDTSLSAKVLWSSGEVEYGSGFVRASDGKAVIDKGFYFLVGMDSTGSYLTGTLSSASGMMKGTVKGKVAMCGDKFTPAFPQVGQACYDVTKQMNSGLIAEGRLVLQFQENMLWGSFYWNGLPSEWVNQVGFTGNPRTSAEVDLNTYAPGGFDIQTYSATLAGQGSATGIIHLSGESNSLGRWRATRSSCQATETLW